MLTNRVAATDANENDRLMAALAYAFGIVSIIILLVDSMKSRPYQKYHAMQSLGLHIIGFIVVVVLSLLPCIGTCIGLVIWLGPAFYYAYITYQGAYFDIPALSNFMRQQGWLPPAGGAPSA